METERTKIICEWEYGGSEYWTRVSKGGILKS